MERTVLAASNLVVEASAAFGGTIDDIIERENRVVFLPCILRDASRITLTCENEECDRPYEPSREGDQVDARKEGSRNILVTSPHHDA